MNTNDLLIQGREKAVLGEYKSAIEDFNQALLLNATNTDICQDIQAILSRLP